MRKRLYVLLEETELREIRRIASQCGMTVSDWVRQALRVARRSELRSDTRRKRQAVRAAAEYAFPTTDIEKMLGEIEGG